MRLDGRYETRYGDKLPGNKSNHKRAVRFDHSPNGYIGITAYEPGQKVNGCHVEAVGDRVLLTPAQAKSLILFIQSRGRAAGVSSSRKGIS